MHARTAATTLIAAAALSGLTLVAAPAALADDDLAPRYATVTVLADDDLFDDLFDDVDDRFEYLDDLDDLAALSFDDDDDDDDEWDDD